MDAWGRRGRWCDRVELPGAVTSHSSNPRSKIVHRETIGIKRKGNVVVSSEPMDRDKVFDNLWGNKDIVEV